MKFAIKHEIKGRIRIHLAQKHMTYRQADILQCYLEKEANISKASVYVRTQDVAVVYTGSRDGLIRLLSRFSYETAQVSESALENSGRELNETYKEKLINSLKEEAEAEAISYVNEIREEAKMTDNMEAKKVVIKTIQRGATETATEYAVSIFHIDSDEIKGRIIGREGRNIRALEAATGVEIIVDDTPEAIVLSGFDPVRREIARLSLH